MSAQQPLPSHAGAPLRGQRKKIRAGVLGATGIVLLWARHGEFYSE